MEIYEKIRLRRKELKMSGQELADKCGYTSRSTISRIEKGEIQIELSKVSLFAKALNIDEMELVGHTSYMELEYIYKHLCQEKQDELLSYARFLLTK